MRFSSSSVEWSLFMSRSYAGAATSANLGSAKTGNAFTQSGTISLIVAKRLREIFPEKTWTYVCELIGAKERVAKHRLAGTRDFTADDLAKILHSECGYDVLAALMAAAPNKPMWWRICSPLMRLADVKKMEAAQEKIISGVLKDSIDARTSLTAARQRAEAVAIHDPEFHSVTLDALRGISLVPDRAVAATKRRK
jgi:hypothetical protein